MINYFKSVIDGYVIGIGRTTADGNITKTEYDELDAIFANKPNAPDGYKYKLADATYEWVLNKTESNLL